MRPFQCPLVLAQLLIIHGKDIQKCALSISLLSKALQLKLHPLDFVGLQPDLCVCCGGEDCLPGPAAQPQAIYHRLLVGPRLMVALGVRLQSVIALEH